MTVSENSERLARIEASCTSCRGQITKLQVDVDALERTVVVLDHDAQKRLGFWVPVVTAVLVSALIKLGDFVLASGALSP